MPDTHRKTTKSVTSKRAAPPSRPAPLSSKRRKRSNENEEPVTNDAKKPTVKRARVVRESKPAVTRKPAPPVNPLPKIPDHLRPTPLMFVWGAGNFGQFGMGTSFLGDYDKPTRNKLVEEKIAQGAFGGEGAGVESVSSGGMHTLFVDEAGKVWSCGVNDNAALGRATKVVQGDSGNLLEDDELIAQPHPIKTLVEENFRAVKVAAGDSISAALNDEGELKVWGSFRAVEGRLGYSSATQHQFRPTTMLTFKGGVEKVSSVAAGHNHLLALTTQGNLYSWGAGEQDQLGRRILARHKIGGTVPEKVLIGKRGKAKVVAIGTGGMTSFAVDEDGILWGWGLNNLGQTGTGSEEMQVPLPTKVVGMSKEELGGARVVAMHGGEHHSMFLTSDGKVYACGRANAGQIGLPKDHQVFVDRGEDRDHLRVPILVEFPDPDDPVITISCGVHNTAAITEGGALYSWGQGPQGELGIKEEEEVWTPTVVVRKEGGKWKAVAVSCGGQHTIGLFMSKEG